MGLTTVKYFGLAIHKHNNTERRRKINIFYDCIKLTVANLSFSTRACIVITTLEMSFEEISIIDYGSLQPFESMHKSNK